MFCVCSVCRQMGWDGMGWDVRSEGGWVCAKLVVQMQSSGARYFPLSDTVAVLRRDERCLRRGLSPHKQTRDWIGSCSFQQTAETDM